MNVISVLWMEPTTLLAGSEDILDSSEILDGHTLYTRKVTFLFDSEYGTIQFFDFVGAHSEV